MKTNIKGTSILLTPAISDYVVEKVGHLDKLTSRYNDVFANVEVGKSTRHHKTGDYFFAEINLHLDGKIFHETVEDEDLYAAIDLVKDNIAETITSYQKRKNTLVRRSARAVKNFIKGIYKWRGRGKLPIY